MADVLAKTPDLAKFLDEQPVAVISLPIDQNATPHAATLGYWHRSEPFSFFFITNKNSQKCQLLKDKNELPAACVVGTYMDTAFTLQMRGTITILDNGQHQSEIDSFCKKRGKSREQLVNPDSVLLCFTPNWARYIDFSQGWDQHFLDLGDE